MLVRLRTVVVQTEEEFTDRQDQVPQILRGVMAGIQRTLFNFLLNQSFDCVIQYVVFIYKVFVKRCAVNLCFIRYILRRDSFKSLFGKEVTKGLQDQAAGPLDARIEFFFQFF